MNLRIDTSHFFRVYVRLNGANRVPEALFLYWDSADSRKALIDPYLYEHAAHNDLEGRIILSLECDAETAESKYYWAYPTDDLAGFELPEALGKLSAGRSAEFQRFLRSCYDTMFNNPNEPFRAVFRVDEE